MAHAFAGNHSYSAVVFKKIVGYNSHIAEEIAYHPTFAGVVSTRGGSALGGQWFAEIAQLAEHALGKGEAPGSSPGLGSKGMAPRCYFAGKATLIRFANKRMHLFGARGSKKVN